MKLAPIVLQLVLLTAIPTVGIAATSTAKNPNILFLFSDDHAQAAISSYGSTVDRTPNIDRIAAGGARFTQSFATNSICTPSRTTLLTGQYKSIDTKTLAEVIVAALPQ